MLREYSEEETEAKRDDIVSINYAILNMITTIIP